MGPIVAPTTPTTTEEESEEDDSESEDAEDSDEEEKVNKKAPAKVGTFVAKRKPADGEVISDQQGSKDAAPPANEGVEAQQKASPGASIAQNKKKANKGEKGEKPKRKPAKTRRQGVCTFMDGVLEQLDALDDAVPDSHQKRLNDKITAVRTSLLNYLEIGRVKHVKVVLEAQITLLSELGSIIAKVGVADGPKGPDAAASRHLGKQAAKLFAIHAPKINQLNNMIATWSGMVAEMNASVQKASTEMSRTASGLIAASVAEGASSS